MTTRMVMWSCDDRQAPFIDTFRATALRAEYDVRIIRPEMPPKAYGEFVSHYRHHSPNRPEFELASFRRWFEISEVVSETSRFVIADTDLAVYTKWRELPAIVTEHAGVVGSQRITANRAEEGINGGFSVWTGWQLREFCEFALYMYRERCDCIAQLYERKKTLEGRRVAISDMTILYRWIQDTGQSFFNTNRLLRDRSGVDHYIDHNFFLPEAEGVRFRMYCGRKWVRRHSSGLELQTDDERPVVADSLHFGGRYKILAPDIDAGRVASATLKSIYIAAGRRGRGVVGRFGVGI